VSSVPTRFFRRLRPPQPRRVDGRVLVLAARSGAKYFHFLFDVVPRLALAAGACDLDAIDAFYVNARRGYERDPLDAAGVPAERILDPADAPHVRAKTLIVPSLPRHRGTPPWSRDFLCSRLLGAAELARGRRLYVSRGSTPKTRIVCNEDEVIGLLEQHGFETERPEKHPLAEQASMFASAELVVAPHGAGITNMVFCRPGTPLVELFPPPFVLRAFWRQAANLGHPYFYALGEREAGTRRDVAADMTIDVGKLETALGSALAELPQGAGTVSA
jgi:capsular polysaccharide biosynthesis protein